MKFVFPVSLFQGWSAALNEPENRFFAERTQNQCFAIRPYHDPGKCLFFSEDQLTSTSDCETFEIISY